jgi:hypothetical protein
MWAMSTALASIVSDAQLLAWIESESPAQRLAACRIAGRFQRSERLLARLRGLLDDPDDSVVKATVDALHRLELAHEVDRILQFLGEETDVVQRSILLEALIALGDPGLPGCPYPRWVDRASKFISSNLQQHRFVERLDERRTKLFREAGEKDQLRPK